jgi:hypothetical protein
MAGAPIVVARLVPAVTPVPVVIVNVVPLMMLVMNSLAGMLEFPVTGMPT